MAISFNPLGVLSGFNLTKLNQNFQNIKTSLSDGLSRSGGSPNQMEADIDLNGNDLLNVGVTNTEVLKINGSIVSPVEIASIEDAINIRKAGAVSGAPDVTNIIQAAIDSLPTTGGAIYVPAGLWNVTRINVHGTLGDKNNVTIFGDGAASRIFQISGAGNTYSVINIKAGQGHILHKLRVTGDYQRGSSPVRGTGFWSFSTAYNVGDTVQTKADGSYALDNFDVSPWLPTNKVWICTVAHTSAASGIIDMTKFIEITDGSIQNQYYTDASYNSRHCVHVDTCFDVLITDCIFEDAVYAACNIGPGALGPSFITAGTDRITFSNNISRNCENGISGGLQKSTTIDSNQFYGTRKLGVQIDNAASYAVVSNNIIDLTADSQTGIVFYNVTNFTCTGNLIKGLFDVGILSTQGINGSISSNIVVGGAKGILLEVSSSGVIVNNNVCAGQSFYGIWIRSITGFVLDSNIIKNAVFEGIRIESCAFFSIVGGRVVSNGGWGGIYLLNSNTFRVQNVECTNNGSSSLVGTGGVKLENSFNGQVSGLICVDTRAPGSKTQDYGIISVGTSSVVSIGMNELGGNGTGEISLVGVNNMNGYFSGRAFSVAELVTYSGMQTGTRTYAHNGRAFNGAGVLEGAGAGTGVGVDWHGGAWRVSGTNQTVLA